MTRQTKEKIVRELYNQGMIKEQIVKETNINQNTVYNYIRNLIKGHHSRKDYLSRLATKKGETKYSRNNPSQQSEFEKKITNLTIKQLNNIPSNKRPYLEDVKFLLEELEKVKTGDRLADIITQIYFENKSRAEIAREIGCSYQRISFLEKKALEKMREIALKENS